VALNISALNTNPIATTPFIGYSAEEATFLVPEPKQHIGL
jgi:hypothetical protein